MKFKEIWQTLAGKDDAETTLKSLVGKDERPGETPEQRKQREDNENSVAAATNTGAF